MKPAIIRPELKLKREIKELPVRNVIYIRLFGDYKLNDYCGTWMRLQQFVQEEKLPMGEVMPYCIFHDDPKVTPIEKLRTDVCMVMPAAVTPKGNIGFKQLPAGRGIPSVRLPCAGRILRRQTAYILLKASCKIRR